MAYASVGAKPPLALTCTMSSTSEIVSSLNLTPAWLSLPSAAVQAAVTVGSAPPNGMPCQMPSRRPASGAGSILGAASPAITASASAQPATLLAIGPIESSVNDSGKAPSVGTRCLLGFQPTRPHSAAGIRVEPPVSVPMAISHMPSATATAPPEVEPPGTRTVEWIAGRAEIRIGADPGKSEFAHVGLCHDHRT